MTQFCRLCAAVISEKDISVGFGTGDGNDFVHYHCYKGYQILKDIIFNSNSTWAMKIFIEIIEVHKSMIRQREQRWNGEGYARVKTDSTD